MNQKTTGQKVVVLGDSGVGKTSILLQFSEHVFRRNTAPTVGAGVINKEVNTQSGPVLLNIWDTAGEERYKSFTGLYTQGAVCCVIIFDLTCKESFENIPNWIEIFNQKAEDEHVIYMVGNKIDLDDEREITFNEAFDWCDKNGYKYFEVSAKTGENVELVFNEIATTVGPKKDEANKIEINTTTENEKEEKCC